MINGSVFLPTFLPSILVLFCRLFSRLFWASFWRTFLSMQYKSCTILSMQYKSLLHVFFFCFFFWGGDVKVFLKTACCCQKLAFFMSKLLCYVYTPCSVRAIPNNEMGAVEIRKLTNLFKPQI
jgi:hypothetical protein